MPKYGTLRAFSFFGILAFLITSSAELAWAVDDCATPDFRVSRDFDIGLNTGFNPVALATADFNGDGKPDLAATDFQGNAVAVFLNDGTGWFASPTKFGVGNQPSAIAVGNFNGDSNPDLAVANEGNNNISILLGSAGGTFGPATNFAVGTDPRSLVVSDFNNDGNADVAVGNAGGSVSVLLGNGAGALSAVFTLSIDGQVMSLAVADFNSDAKRDLAISIIGSSIGENGFFVLTGDGAGGFSSPVKVFGQAGTSIAAADLNGDTKADLVLGHFSGMAVLISDGAGGFSAPTFFTLELGGAVVSIAVGDLDSDSKPDVAASGGGIGVTFFKGDGAGGFSRRRTYLGKDGSTSVVLSDFDGDGKPDIATGGPAGLLTGVSIILNLGGGEFEAPTAVATNNANFPLFATDLEVDDFNNDGRPDMAVSHSGQAGVNAVVAILLNNVGGGFTATAPISFFPGTSLNTVVTGDFNEDGKADVAVAGTISIPFTHVVAISLGNGDGTFAAPVNVTVGQTPFDLAVADFNNDANLDLVVVNGSSQSFSILFGNGLGGFSVVAENSVGTRFDRVAIGDFNSDSKQDIVITDFDDKQVLVLQNNDNGQFGIIQSISLPGPPTAVVVDDFNEDGKRDFAVTNQLLGGSALLEEGTLSVLLGNGTGGFSAPVHHKISSMPGDLLSRDLDADGNVDLAFVDTTFAIIGVLSGDGAGAFSPVVNFNGRGVFALSAHDFNADGHLDLVGPSLLLGKAPTSQPCLFADNASVTEGDSGSTNLEVPIRLSAPSSDVVKVNFMTRLAFATQGDFTASAGTVTFQPGETNKLVMVPIVGDIIDEPEESFTLHLSGPLNARISDGIAKLNIQDNDPQPSISISDVTVAEGNSPFNPNSANFTVTLSAPSDFVVSVGFSVASGTATVGDDLDFAQGVVSFGPGTTSRTVTIGIRGDVLQEPDETFFVNLGSPENATIADNQGQGTIQNDDPVPAITILNATGFEQTGIDSTVSVTVNLSNPSSLTISANFATADDTATAGSDYVSSTGTVTFNPGETQKSISLTIKDDLVDEVTENFLINLSDPVNATIADGQAFVQIIDNDGPTISISDVTVVEGQSGRTNANFTISLSAASPQAIIVRATTANGTASSIIFPPDFQGFNNRIVIIPAGSTTVTTTVLINGDVAIEPDETFFVNLSQPQGATIADAQGVGTILNDDTTSVQLNTDSLTVNETDGSVQLTVTRVGDLTGVFIANYETFDGTASEKSDYTTSLAALRFEPGQTTKTITVFITNDALVEGPENFFILLSGPNGAPTNSPSSAIITINSDDNAPGPNPIDSSDFFVRQHYRDFLNRDPDDAGLAFWIDQIEQCGTDVQCREVRRINVSAAFFLSIEFQETGFLAYRMYKAAFGDATSPNVPGTVPIIRFREFLLDGKRMGEGFRVGIGDWELQLELNKRAFALEFVQRARFLAAYPTSMTADQFVTKLEQNVGGALSSSEKEALIALLGSTPADSEKRAQVVRAVADDADLRQAELNRAFVLTQYYGYLRRNPDDPPDTNFGGWKFWLDKLNQFNGNFIQAEMVKAFISSIEYRERFGP